jgi:hypothetical protein
MGDATLEATQWLPKKEIGDDVEGCPVLSSSVRFQSGLREDGYLHTSPSYPADLHQRLLCP